MPLYRSTDMTLKDIKYRLMAFAAAVCMVAGARAAVSAASVMDAMQAKLASSAAVEVMFTINGASGNVQGSAIMSGSAFFFETPDLCVWYDGKTQWALLRSSDEVNITEPTVEELTSTNPFAILSSYASTYKVRRLADSNGCYNLRLTPVSGKSAISAIDISCDIKTKWPRMVKIVFADKRHISLSVDSIKTIAKQPASVFRYDKAKFPAAEIIDLR